MADLFACPEKVSCIAAPHLTGRDTSNHVRCSKLASPRGGDERETGRGPYAIVGQVIPAHSVVFLCSPRPHHAMGHTLIPKRSVERHRAVCGLCVLPSSEGGIRAVRYIGVDWPKTNLVVCFLAADDTARTESVPFTADGRARFTRQLEPADAVAGRGDAEPLPLLRSGEAACRARRGGGHVPLPSHRPLKEKDRPG